jgi:hypothetical protein
VCRFHIAAGEKIHADKQFISCPCLECHEASKHHLLKFGFLLLVRFNLGFTTEGRLAAVLVIPSLGVPNWSVIYINTAPSTAGGEAERSSLWTCRHRGPVALDVNGEAVPVVVRVDGDVNGIQLYEGKMMVVTVSSFCS